MFDDFAEELVPTRRGDLYAKVGGNGPPLVLLHGYPQTHLTWRDVAPHLVDRHTVVALDLPGYGRSLRPTTSPDHASHCKRAMAADVVQVMAALGFDRYDVAGHDRGARVAYRLALDSPQHVRRLALIDIVPTDHTWSTADADFAINYWHWSFLSQPAPLPEALITAAPDAFFAFGGSLGMQVDSFPAEVQHEYRRMFREYDSVHAMCEDYRAGATIDREIDEQDGATRIAAPTLVLWGAKGLVAKTYDVLEVWRGRADDVHGRALDATHFVPEDQPEEVVREFEEFFGRE
jgi:haloacetate dehalogenase